MQQEQNIHEKIEIALKQKEEIKNKFLANMEKHQKQFEELSKQVLFTIQEAPKSQADIENIQLKLELTKTKETLVLQAEKIKAMEHALETNATEKDKLKNSLSTKINELESKLSDLQVRYSLEQSKANRCTVLEKQIQQLTEELEKHLTQSTLVFPKKFQDSNQALVSRGMDGITSKPSVSETVGNTNKTNDSTSSNSLSSHS